MQVRTNLLGMGVTVAAVLFTGVYQVRPGARQTQSYRASLICPFGLAGLGVR